MGGKGASFLFAAGRWGGMGLFFKECRGRGGDGRAGPILKGGGVRGDASGSVSALSTGTAVCLSLSKPLVLMCGPATSFLQFRLKYCRLQRMSPRRLHFNIRCSPERFRVVI